MAIGQGYAYHPGGAINRKISDGHAWAFSNGAWRPVKAAWAFYDGDRTWHQWYPHGGGALPPTSHIVTLGGRHVAGHWSFSIPAAAHGRITYAAAIVTTRAGGLHVAGKIYAHPSGGELATYSQDPSTTKHYHVWAGPFNGAANGLRLAPDTHISRVSLRITYHD